eukprot:2836622-Pyramimonas_sp.AAC.1
MENVSRFTGLYPTGARGGTPLGLREANDRGVGRTEQRRTKTIQGRMEGVARVLRARGNVGLGGARALGLQGGHQGAIIFAQLLVSLVGVGGHGATPELEAASASMSQVLQEAGTRDKVNSTSQALSRLSDSARRVIVLLSNMSAHSSLVGTHTHTGKCRKRIS